MVKSVKKEKKAAVVEETVDESALVMLKKENAKVLEKSVREVQQAVNESFDLKQVATAAKALQKHEKEQSKASKSLLKDENAAVHLCFTMSKVPKKHSPKPVQIKLEKPFNTEKNLTRVCLFVKDPETDMKAKLDSLNLPCIADAIGYDKLKNEYK